jgi:Ca2+/H+ antiporter
MNSEERRVLRCGGLAGIAHAAFVVLTAVAFFAFVPPATADVHGLAMRDPEARNAFALGETFGLVGGILAVPYVLALVQALQAHALAPASGRRAA